MKLKNGTDEEQAIIAPVWAALKDLKGDYGTAGLQAARRVAMKGYDPKNAKLIHGYGLVVKRGTQYMMRDSVKNVILSAVTARGELVNPVQS